ncbi:MAG: glycosyltransferase family 1 protein [Stigonema ocellatum SAG 48.90 = DSM 106950]|nr:glycosyltransferase family 1 protein [Stigonema ocellatum SAG 48.90 = DSM 106950]
MYVTTTNKYFVCLKGAHLNPVPWEISDADETLSVDCVYFGKVFQAMEKDLKIKDLTFYLTWNTNELPSYGQNVVAVILGDEYSRIPKYIHKVGAVFKTLKTRPTLACNPLLQPSYKNIIDLMQFLKVWIIRLPGWLNYILPKTKTLPISIDKLKPIYDIPLGYYKQLDLPIKDIKERLYDIFFAGSVISTYPIWSWRFWLIPPKDISRKEMILKTNTIKNKYPEFKIEVATSSDFGSEAKGSTDKRSYSEKLMDAKICLAPRGNVFETFRFFEGLRYGCIIITEKLPSRWFYDGAPCIEITSWNQLENILLKLKNDENLMQKLHQQSLDWWKKKCSEDAIGRYFAEKLNIMKCDSTLQ